MCDHNEKRTWVYHLMHCYPVSTAYLLVVTTLILLLAVCEWAGAR